MNDSFGDIDSLDIDDLVNVNVQNTNKPENLDQKVFNNICNTNTKDDIEENIITQSVEKESKFQFSVNKSGMKENKRYDKNEEEKVKNEFSKIESNDFKKSNNKENITSKNFNSIYSSQKNNVTNYNMINNDDYNNLPKIKNPFDSINQSNLQSISQSLFSENKNCQSFKELPKKKGTFDNNLLKSSFMRRSAAQSQKIKKKDNLTSDTSSKFERNSISNLEFSQSQNVDINSRDFSIKFDIIENEEANNKNYKRNNLQNIIESDEENEGDETLRKLNLEDIVIFVKKFNDGNNLNPITNKYEIGKKISEIINNNPFQNISFKILNDSINFRNFFAVSNKQIIEKIDSDFYENLDSLNKFEQIIKKYHHKEFKHYYSLCVSEIYLLELQELKGYRTVLCDDGNGFLRAFIFNLFEVFIINKNVEELRKITYEISTKISTEFKYNNIVVEKKEIIIIMKIIICHLENSKIEDALLVFTNAFLYHSSFEFGLIKFIRIALGTYISNNKDIFTLNNLRELIPFKYIEQKTFNHNLYIEERVMIMDYEIDTFIFFILPHLFNINLRLFLDNDNITLECNTPNKNNGTINIIHDFSYYKIGYDSNFMRYNKIVPYISKEKNEKCNIILINNNTNLICEICKKTPNEFVKLHKIFEQICKNCLLKNINEAIRKRLKLFIEDFYLHEEYYCSDIQYTNSLEYNLFISNTDIKQLYNLSNGIPTIIRGNIMKLVTCNLCNEKFEKKKAYTLFCGCIFCQGCLEKLIIEKTNGKVILNEFEKKQEKIIINCPKCNTYIPNYHFFIDKFFDVEKYKEEALNRLQEKMKIHCCICGSKDICFCFDLINNNLNLTHSLCQSCKFGLDQQLIRDKKRSYQTQFKCIYCKNQHIYNMINCYKDNDISKKDKQNKCCSIY